MKADQITWHLENPANIGGNKAKLTGSPTILKGTDESGIWFDGKGDGIFLEANPLAGLTEFTVEAVFRPERGGPEVQKFIHFGEAHGDRFLFETRVPDPGHWCFDAAMHSREPSLALMDDKLLHGLDEWYHAAVTFSDLEMVTYIDYRKELAGRIEAFSPMLKEAVSIGVRMDMNSWYRGAIKLIRITQGILTPDEFIKY